MVRIRAIVHPKVWQIFMPWFFVFLTATIMTGTILSRLAYGNYYFLVDVSIFMYRNFNALVVGADTSVSAPDTLPMRTCSV